MRKFVRNVSRGRERPVSPEFVSRDAARLESRSRSPGARKGDTPSSVRDITNALPSALPSPKTPNGTKVDAFYLHSHLEALALEPIIRPTLGRMRDKVAEAEALLTPMPPLPQHLRRGSLTVPEQAHLLPPVPVKRDAVILHKPLPAIVVTPTGDSQSSSSSEHNPFELEFGSVASLEVTPLPKRPPLPRKAASYRTQRELPLRVQAVRRSHQEMYARQILAQSSVRQGNMVRRASETEVAQRPKPTPVQSSTSQRSQSLAHLGEMPSPRARSRSQSREPSRRRHERLPSGPHKQRTADAEDFYLLAAMNEWSFDG